MSERLKKTAAVVFLTLMIWAWAFLSLEGEITLVGSLNLSPATGPEYLVTFRIGQEARDLLNLKLRFLGAPSEINDLSRRYRAAASDPDKEHLDFYYNPAEYGHTEAGIHRLDLLDLVKKAGKTRGLALTTAACDPETVEVQIEKLAARELKVEVRNEAGQPVEYETIQPAFVTFYVPENYTGQAVLVLTAEQILVGRSRPLRERPFVTLGTGSKKHYADQYVQIRMPSAEPLRDQVLQGVQIGYVFAKSLQGKYEAQLINESEFWTLKYRATDEARTAYEQRQYHLFIQVLEGDEKLDPVPLRTVLYNFPADMVRSRLIEPPSPPLQAQIKLVPVVPATTP